MLSAASPAVQALADVAIDGRRTPPSLWHLSVGESDERESATDALASRAHRERERALVDGFVQELAVHEGDLPVIDRACISAKISRLHEVACNCRWTHWVPFDVLTSSRERGRCVFNVGWSTSQVSRCPDPGHGRCVDVLATWRFEIPIPFAMTQHVPFSQPEPSRWPSMPLIAAPHRLLFFVGAINVLAAMLWWWMRLSGWTETVLPGVPSSWLHGFLMQYQVLPTFMFGFLLTVYPRWMGLREATRWHYLPVGLALLSGQALTLGAAWTGSTLALSLGWLNTTAGWLAGWCVLVSWAWRARSSDTHVRSTLLALTLGLAGVLLFGAGLLAARPGWQSLAIRTAAFGLLLPVYVTVAHRVFPFFAGNVVPGYRVYRPDWLLPAMWLGLSAHLVAEWVGLPAWRWPVDLGLAVLFAYLLWRWWPRAKAPPLLTVLFAGFLWLPVAMALYALDGITALTGVGPALGRAPLHALAVGFFGTVLVAMVTRVTAGHSGRPLRLGRIAAFAFVSMQLVALARVVGELMPDPTPWWRGSALAWLLAFLPWVLRSAWIYLTPRLDGRPG